MNFLAGTVLKVGEDSTEIFLEGISDRPLLINSSNLEVATGEEVTVGIRPENFIEPSGDSFNLEVEITFEENLGGSTLLHAPGHSAGALVIESRADERPAVGPIVVAIDPKRIHLFNGEGRAIAHAK